MVKKERNQEIDIMKGLLTLAMILCHCLQFFGKEDAGIEKILVNVINLTTFSGFLFCFGFVCCLASLIWHLRSRRSSGRILSERY